MQGGNSTLRRVLVVVVVIIVGSSVLSAVSMGIRPQPGAQDLEPIATPASAQSIKEVQAHAQIREECPEETEEDIESFGSVPVGESSYQTETYCLVGGTSPVQITDLEITGDTDDFIVERTGPETPFILHEGESVILFRVTFAPTSVGQKEISVTAEGNFSVVPHTFTGYSIPPETATPTPTSTTTPPPTATTTEPSPPTATPTEMATTTGGGTTPADETTTTGFGPGFGLVGAIVALLAGTLLALRHR